MQRIVETYSLSKSSWNLVCTAKTKALSGKLGHSALWLKKKNGIKRFILKLRDDKWHWNGIVFMSFNCVVTNSRSYIVNIIFRVDNRTSTKTRGSKYKNALRTSIHYWGASVASETLTGVTQSKIGDVSLFIWRASVASETLTGVTQSKIGDVYLFIYLFVYMFGRTYVDWIV